MIYISIPLHFSPSSLDRREVSNTVHPEDPGKGPITKTCLYNFDPLKPHFYIVKLGFTGVYIIFLISDQNIEAVLMSTHNLCFVQKHEKYQNFLSENFHFLVIKFAVCLNRNVFVMLCNAARDTYSCYWGPEMKVRTRLIRPLPPNVAFCRFLHEVKHHGHPSRSLRKHAYSNILKILPPKNGNFSDKNLIFFIFLLKT